jgi:murein DD-endopeptidase MepM/ murein hydrolase activator NlpD
MPAPTKRKRGATAIRSDARRLPQLPALQLPMPSKRTLAGIALCACVAITFILAPSDDSDHANDRELAGEPQATTVIPADQTVTASTEAAAAAPPPEQPWLEQKVRSGDNLSRIFKRAGFNTRDVHRVVSESPDGKSLANIFPGQIIAFKADDNGQLAAVRHVRSPLETVTYQNTDQGFDSHVNTRSPEVRESQATGEIISSLFLAGQKAGLSHNMIMQLANIFGGVIDFVQDPRKGDTIRLVYEELYLDGEKYKDGAIVAASFSNRGTTYNAFRYTDSAGDVGYYNEDGVSMRKAFLLAPVDFSRISSNFNLRRLHPIYKTTRPHRGTDYAAPRGTPVFAAGDGRVIKAGYSRANGNYVFIQHGEQYVTRYLHLNKRKVKRGQRVSQSQVIGTVGSTGAATGPHLHYEFLMNGVHRNPRTIHKKLPKAKTLPASELAMFRQAINEATLQLASLKVGNHLAMHQQPGSTPPHRPTP